MTIIADSPSPEMYASGLEIDCQCARCGSSMDSDRCNECEDGWIEGDDDADICGCGMTKCWVCGGKPVSHHCMSSPEFCNANPLPGREHVRRGAVEWFVIEEPK